MAATESQEDVKQEDNDEQWEIFYWKMRNRGNWIRFLFEEAGVDKYVDHSTEEDFDIKSYFMSYSDGESNPINDQSPAFAPPAIRKGDFFLSQSEVIVNYLAEEFNMAPTEKMDKIKSQQILANCNDLIRDIYSQRGRGKENNIKFFEGGRFEKWLNVLEKPLLKRNKKDEEEIYYFDHELKVTYADLVVFNVMDGLEEFCGKKFDSYFKSHEVLLKHFECIGARPVVKGLLTIQKEEYKWKWFNGRSFDEMQVIMGFVDKE